MAANGTARVFAHLYGGIRVLAVVLALALLTFAVRGTPLPFDQPPLPFDQAPSPLDRLTAAPRSVGAVLTTTADGSATAAGPVSHARLQRQLQNVFPHHATLVVRFMRSTVAGDPGFVEAANALLVRNTRDLQAALVPAVGSDDAAAFARRWQSLTQALFGYAVALRDDDGAARDEALSQLSACINEQADLLTEATGGGVERKVASASLRMHVDLLVYQIDAYARGDYDQAYKLEREAYAQMFPFAGFLAAAAPGDLEGAAQPTPRDELGAQFSRLLGMHVELSIDAVRGGVAGSDEFTAATAALDATSRELSAMFDGLLGPRPSRQLSALWTDQLDLLMRYAVAVADGQPSKQRHVRAQLRRLSARFERILREQTPDDLAAAADAAAALRSQHGLLLNQLDAYARGDHARAHDIAYTAHHRVPALARPLARALVSGLPLGGARTGGGGTAPGV